jgi:hypothetical protein
MLGSAFEGVATVVQAWETDHNAAKAMIRWQFMAVMVRRKLHWLTIKLM